MQNRTPNPPTPPANGHGGRISERVAAARAATEAVRRAAQPLSPGAVAAEGPAFITAKPTSQGTRTTLNIRTVQQGALTWIDMQRPGQAEIEWLQAHYPGFHPLHFDDITSRIQRPKLDERDDYLFLVLHFPVYNKITRLTTASEVDIFAGPGYVITVHSGHLRPLLRLFDQARDDPDVRATVMGRGAGFLLYTIIDKLVDYCFPILNKIDQNIEQVEDVIFSENARETVQEISLIRRDIIAFRRVIKPQISVIASLDRRAQALLPLLGEDLSEYFGDLNDHLAKIWDTLEDYKDVIEGLSDTYNSLTSTRINDVIKVLTILSVILLPLTLVSGIYGMNFQVLPGAEHPYGFWITLGIMALIVLLMLAYFKFRRWI
jgi:magnesium transporter